MNIQHIDESSKWWMFIILVILNNLHKFSSNDLSWFHRNDEYSSKCWHFITMMSIHLLMIFHPNDEFSSKWWNFISMMIFHHNYEFPSKWWIFTTRNFHPNGEISSSRCIFIKIRCFHQSFNCNYGNSSNGLVSQFWWHFIILISFHHSNEFSSIW